MCFGHDLGAGCVENVFIWTNYSVPRQGSHVLFKGIACTYYKQYQGLDEQKQMDMKPASQPEQSWA